MKRAAVIASALLMGASGLLSATAVGWTIWVFATGNGWLLDLMTSGRLPSATVAFAVLCSVFGFFTCLSFWGAGRVLRIPT